MQSTADVAGGRLLFLDTLEEGRGHGRLCPQRLAWLAARLDEARDRPVYVFLHHAPHTFGLSSFERILLVDPDPFLALLHGHGQVRHLFFGHVHVSVTGTLDGIPFSADRGTCHHILPDLEAPGRPAFVEGTPSFSVALLGSYGVVIHALELPGYRPVVRPADPPAADDYLATGPSGSRVRP